MKTGKRRMAKGKRLNNKHVSFIIIFCCLSVFLPLAFCPSPFALSLADDEVARIQKVYEVIKDIKGDFVQKSYIKDLKRTDTFTGQFFIKPPRMKWEFRGDKPQVVYITGNDIIIYQKKEKQVFKTKFDRDTYGQVPIALLGGFGDINKEFDVSIKKGRLLLKPIKPMGAIAQIELTPSSGAFPIEALTVFDTASNRIDITLKDVRVNTGLDERVFAFTPPKDVTVLQQ